MAQKNEKIIIMCMKCIQMHIMKNERMWQHNNQLIFRYWSHLWKLLELDLKVISLFCQTIHREADRQPQHGYKRPTVGRKI